MPQAPDIANIWALMGLSVRLHGREFKHFKMTETLLNAYIFINYCFTHFKTKGQTGKAPLVFPRLGKMASVLEVKLLHKTK